MLIWLGLGALIGVILIIAFLIWQAIKDLGGV